MIAGKPLIAWTIEAAQNSRLLSRFVVSTEDKEIANVSREFGAEVLERPAELATDEATSLSVIQHVLSKIDAEAVVLLEATSPVREDGLIDSCIKIFQKRSSDNLATGYYCKYKEYGAHEQRRQEIDGFFYNVGCVYIIKSDLIRQDSMFGKTVERIEISREESVEIDDDFDFWLAEQILCKRTQKVAK